MGMSDLSVPAADVVVEDVAMTVPPALGPGDADPRRTVAEMPPVAAPLAPGASAVDVDAAPMLVPPAAKPGDGDDSEQDDEPIVFPPAGPGGTAHFTRPVRRPKSRG